ncbi:Histone acetyltransferase gcn5 [Psilocybe cubensis]|uniref:Histone acetyltransferase gcn5 n=1 Tax=Psilocybe cubensis TaxID=181762 RepID=A0ACB8HB94_PSICU|nr:Histone acetyltransferase gcn5 [Psilocybe cubensis]KAH9485109.1 Histone acetyltransferase gcn5 [Psilocybe cubensis]
MKVGYPSCHSFEKLDTSLLALKIARHSPCSRCIKCPGLHPPPGIDVVVDGQSDSSLGDLGQYGSDDEDEPPSSYLSSCACGHGVKEHNADEKELGRVEFNRKARVAIRLDELLQDSGRLPDFDYTDDDISSLRKQMAHTISSVSLAATNSSPDHRIENVPPRSPTSSILSDPPQPATKKRRVSFSSLSDADHDEDDDEDDDEEDRPLAARITMGSRSVPGKRSGKQAPGKKTKKSHTLAGGAVPASSIEEANANAPTFNGKHNGINGHEPRIKQEDKMDEGQLNRLTAGIPVDSVGRSSAGHIYRHLLQPPVRTEKPSAIELRKGVIQITAVENDRQARSLIILTGLKTLFQKQLPKMPREYIARLVFDINSKSLAIIKRGYKVVGGICYRPFIQRGFAEIVFFATNSADQEKGYGGMLMDHFKAHIRKTYPDMMHFLTYADNYAVGYFEKQGFSKDISLDRSVWAGYIKDYEGGTIMQCTMLPKIDYLDKQSIFKQQTEAILAKIREKSTSHIVYPGLPQFQPGAPPGIKVDPKTVPGLRETGWTPEMAALLARGPVKPSTRTTMEKILAELIEEPRSWAFRDPVDPADVADYFDVIKHPMGTRFMMLFVYTDYIYPLYLIFS